MSGRSYKQEKSKPAFRLSVVDTVIAAVAKLRQATLVHKDPELSALASEVTLQSLPFKKTTNRKIRKGARTKSSTHTSSDD